MVKPEAPAQAEGRPALVLEDLALSYPLPGGALRAFEGVYLRIAAGGVAAVVGPSGCGKTSIIRAVAGLRPPAAGRILVGPGGSGARMAVILQDYGLLPWKSVSANVELPLLLAGVGAGERRSRAAALLGELGLGDFARFYPARLSGGMRQRVALARALVQEPEILLMDEPFSSLDALTRESMQETLLELQRRHGTTVLLVTHSIEEAAYLADEVYVMRGRNPGRVTARVEAPDRPASGGARARGSSFRSSPRFLEYMSGIRAGLEGAS
jgi:NitT/TauT family transport system ATP-binding protein